VVGMVVELRTGLPHPLGERSISKLDTLTTLSQDIVD
jgi:hypothetical protein